VTHPGDAELDALLDGLDPTPWEREMLRQTLAQVDDPFADPRYDVDDDGDGTGPWHDAAGPLPDAGAALDDAYGAEAARLAEDEEDRASLAKRPSDEARLARALDRVGRGSYTPPGYFRPARDTGGRFGHMCGPLDPLGGCAARYHQPGCATLTLTDAPNGSYEDSESWNAVLRRHLPPPGDARLSNPAEPGPGEPHGQDFPSFDDLVDPLGEPGSADPGLHAEVLHSMGLADAPPRPLRPRPDVSGLIEELGLR
jgi:hypothetical protein